MFVERFLHDHLLPLCLALALGFALARPAAAAWPSDAYTNVPVCNAAGIQYAPKLVSDGTGGAIITWFDSRADSSDIYVGHVLASGKMDPAWPADGRALCTAAFHQDLAAIVGDGVGGAIVAWRDARASFDIGGGIYVYTKDIYAQRVRANGTVDPAWPANGRALCTSAGGDHPGIVSDGVGGAIVAWQDSRSDANDIYAQHVLASGAVDPAWPANGRALCTAPGFQEYPSIVSDGAGGAIVAWYDFRGASVDIYAQHVLASGAVDPAWPANGRALCTAANTQTTPTIASDGAGGAIVTWNDSRSGASDIYAQHVLASGAVDPAWPTDGRALCTAANSQWYPVIVPDGARGAVVTWYDARGASMDIYAQHVLASGAVDPAWPTDGRALCTAVGAQTGPSMDSDGAGGATVSWTDFRSGSGDVYAQHVLASGAVDPEWPTDGRALCAAGNSQGNAAIVADGAGGAIAAWEDYRAGSGIYAQRVGGYGYLGTPEAEIVRVKDVPHDQGGAVKVAWDGSYLETLPYGLVTHYKLFRSVPPQIAALKLARGARLVAAEGADARSPDRPGDLLETTTSATTYYWEYIATVNADFLAHYSYLAPTVGDSTAAGAPMTVFMVQARTAGSEHWESWPDSAYSVDDLAPATPAPFIGNYAAGTTHLHWRPNTESDLAHYQLYRGSTLEFVPGPSNLIASPPDTGYADVGSAGSFYKLSAVDVHGNQSGFALLTPAGTTDVGMTAPAVVALARPRPNPATAVAALGVALPREARVRLAIFDLAGRRVRMLADGVMPAGEHTVRWDLRGEAGTVVANGLYFARLEAEGRTLTQRFSVAR